MTSEVKNLPVMQDMQKTQFHPWVGKIHWRRAWQPTPKFLPGKSNAQRSLAGYSPLGHEESDMTEATEHAGTHGTGRFFCAQKDSV